MLLAVQQLFKSYDGASILQSISFLVQKADRIGIVGPNGVGKSTLLRLLTGEEKADAGTISYAPQVQYGYLPQTHPPFYGHSIQDMLLEAAGQLRQLEDRMRELEEAMGAAQAEALSSLMKEYTALSTRFQNSGGYELDHKLEVILAGLHLSYIPRTQEVETLSSGEKARVGLATLLLRSPDLLLLDEPTNHLDSTSLAWLEEYLSTYPGAILLTSHDRDFLNRTVTNIYEIDEHKHHLTCYVGNYESYLRAKVAERKQWEKDYKEQQEKLQALQKHVRLTSNAEHFYVAPKSRDRHAKHGSFQKSQRAQASNIRSAQLQFERLEANLLPPPPEVLTITSHFAPQTGQTNDILLLISDLTKVRGERLLFQNVNLTIAGKARILLTGPSGVGKTTLLRLLVGLETPTSGQIEGLTDLRIGYLPQEPALSLHQTLLQVYRADRIGYEQEFVEQLSRTGFFRQEEMSKMVRQLSIGQQRKLEIACLMAIHPEILLLDEPTNYLSMDVLESFESAIAAFTGPVVAISHDRRFINHFKGDIWELTSQGQVKSHLI